MTSVIFCVALSEYDQVLLEDSNQNRMAESLVLFESIINSRWFQRSSIILFLNKIDIFKQKLARRPLSDYFPEYTGGDDVNKAAKYILSGALCRPIIRSCAFTRTLRKRPTRRISGSCLLP